MDHDERLIDADYRAHARDGEYSPGAHGPWTACRVRIERPTVRAGADAGPFPAVRFDVGGVTLPTNAQPLAILVRASELTPARGGRFKVGGLTYEIKDDPALDDALGLEWRCSVARP